MAGVILMDGAVVEWSGVGGMVHAVVVGWSSWRLHY
jgi:hypothetical protein